MTALKTVKQFNMDLAEFGNSLLNVSKSATPDTWDSIRDDFIKSRGMNPDDFKHIKLEEESADS